MPRPLPPHIADVVARSGGSETEAVREHILEAAHRVIVTHGLAAASTRAVAAEAGIGAGTVYNYFDNRVELLAQAITHRMAVLTRPLEELPGWAGQATVTANLRRVARLAASVLDEIVPLFAAAFSDTELTQALHRSQAGDRHFEPIANVERYLRAERDLGRIAPDADCRAAAHVIISLIHDRAFQRHFAGAAHEPAFPTREIDLVVRALTVT
jgi:AcrR family transcriptional regulator